MIDKCDVENARRVEVVFLKLPAVERRLFKLKNTQSYELTSEEGSRSESHPL